MAFNRFVPFLSLAMNNRDHRKILVIDGHTAYNGGINLADEYINEKEVYGHWKDTAVKITGEAVRSFTVMYLQMWHVSENGAADEYEKYLQNIVFDKPLKDDGFVIPYGEMPTVPTEVAKTVYESLFNTAKKYVHVMTPYFIVEQEFFDTMRYAAQRGSCRIYRIRRSCTTLQGTIIRSFWRQAFRCMSIRPVLSMPRYSPWMAAVLRLVRSTWITEAFITILNVAAIFMTVVSYRILRPISREHWRTVRK